MYIINNDQIYHAHAAHTIRMLSQCYLPCTDHTQRHTEVESCMAAFYVHVAAIN